MLNLHGYKYVMKVRKATREDCPEMLQLIRELAEYEKAPEEVTVDPMHFEESGFGANPVWWAFVVEEVEEVDAGAAADDDDDDDESAVPNQRPRRVGTSRPGSVPFRRLPVLGLMVPTLAKTLRAELVKLAPEWHWAQLKSANTCLPAVAAAVSEPSLFREGLRSVTFKDER
jgi:hypothetical protein